MPRHYCTYFDQRYLVRGLAMHRSLVRHDADAILWVLCLDDASHAILQRLGIQGIRPVRLAELEDADPELREIRGSRTDLEYYFTLSPIWPRYVLRLAAGAESITYLDADLYFFSSPDPVFAEMGDAPALVIAHRFPEEFRYLEVHGIYNVGFLTFRNDARGRALLDEWRQQCLEWCHQRVEPGRYADQKYLDAWPTRHGVHALRHPGAGVAPWNWMGHALRVQGSRVTVDGNDLIFFHFHGLRLLNRWFFLPSDTGYGRIPWRPRRAIFGPYLRELVAIEDFVRGRLRKLDPQLARAAELPFAKHSLRDLLGWLRRRQLYTRFGVIAV